MKQWTVTYREKSGLKTSVVIEAEDRAGVFAELKQRGINAISITEGVVKAKRSATSGGVSKGVWGVVATLVVVALAGVVWMVMPESAPRELVEKRASKKTRNEKVERPNVAMPTDEDKGVDKIEEPVDVSSKVNEKTLAKPISRRAPRGTPRVIENAIARGERTKPLFRYPSENYLALYAIPGEEVPPTPEPNDFEQDMKNALVAPIEIDPDDTDADIEKKNIVAGMKEELRQWLKDGGTVSGYMDQVKDRQSQEAALVGEARRVSHEILAGENVDPERALNVWVEENKKLTERGIAPIPMPRRLRTFLKRNTSWDGQTPLM